MPWQSARSSQVMSHVAPCALLQSRLHSELSSHVIEQSVFGAHVSVQLLSSVQRALHAPLVHVNRQVSPFLHWQFGPHSRGVPGAGPVSGAPVSRTPASDFGAGVDPVAVPEGDPDEDGGVSALPVPMFQS